MTCARRGVSLEQRTHGTVMFQSFFCYLARRSQRLRTLLIARCPQLRSEAQACCVRCGRLAPCPVLRLQLRNPGLSSLPRKFKTRRESQLSSPGNLPDTKPKWPPDVGNSRLTASATSPRFGNACPGKKGSFRALIRRVGTLMCRSQDLLLERIQ